MTNQQSVVELRRKVNDTLKVLSMDLSNWDPRTRTGMEGRQNQARGEIDTLKVELAKKILENSTAMLVMRDVSITPAIIQEGKANAEKVLLLDFLSVEKGLVKKIYGDAAKTFPFNTETINRMNMLVTEEIGGKIGATSMPWMEAKSNEYGISKTREDIVAKMEKITFATFDTELKEKLFRVLAFEGVYDRLQEDAVAVFIINVPKNFVKAFSSYAGKTIVVTEETGVPGSVTVTPESNASELIGAVTQAQNIVNKRVRNTTKRKPTETTDQQGTEEN